MKLQQGDVILRSAAEIPKDAKRVERKRKGYVLAEGEATGHAHVIEEEVEMYELDGVLYLKTEKPVTLRHEEHKPVTVGPGSYRIGIVREYDFFDETAFPVRD